MTYPFYFCNLKYLQIPQMLWILERKKKRIKLEVQLESNSQPLGWESNALTTAPPV